MIDFPDRDEFSWKWGTDDFNQYDQNEEISLKGEFFSKLSPNSTNWEFCLVLVLINPTTHPPDQESTIETR